MDSTGTIGDSSDEQSIKQRLFQNEPTNLNTNTDTPPRPNSTSSGDIPCFAGLSYEILSSELKDFSTNKREEFLQSLDQQITAITEDLIKKSLSSVGLNQDEPDSKSRKRKKSGSRKDETSLPTKVFRHKDSVLTELLQISHIRSVYHAFVAILIIFSLNTTLLDLANGDFINTYHLEVVVWSFGKFKDVIMIWLLMKISTIMIFYPAYVQWSSTRPQNGSQVTYHDWLWLAILISYQITFLIVPIQFVFEINLPPSSSSIIVLEQIRMMMKTHAFIRENIPRVIYYKEKEPSSPDDNNSDHSSIEDIEDMPCPDFSYYLYFLFAPTLVYCNSYPRTPRIRWRYVVSNFSQVFFCTVFVYYLFARFCYPIFKDFNSTHVSPHQLVLVAFGCMLPGGLLLLCCFFAILHSWLNAFAEMLRFGDRLFYKEWWTSTNYGTYYRTWNVVVHDWLYTYVYREVYQLVKVKKYKKIVAATSVFLLSAVFHEYALIVAFKFFYPVLFIFFGGAGFPLIFIKGHARIGNVFLWTSLFTGMGLLMCFYSMEWYARINCPVYFDSILDYVIPRSWFCGL